MIVGYINGQSLELYHSKVVEKSVDYLTADFQFMTNEWKDFRKWVHFSQGDIHYQIELKNDKVLKTDHLNLLSGEWDVYVHGSFGREIITTNKVKLVVETTGELEGEYPEETPIPPYDDILNKIGDIENLKTADKTNLVNSINEVLRKANQGGGGGQGGNGVGIDRIEQTTTSSASSGKNIITVYLTNGDSYNFEVTNGRGVIGFVASQKIPTDREVEVVTVEVSYSDGSDDIFEIAVPYGKDGKSGVYVGSGDMPDGYNVQIDPDGEAISIPTKVSELENDKGYITLDDLPEIPEINGITPEQTTFFEFLPSNNLLDASTKQVGMLNNDGKIYTGGSYDNYRYFEQYIPVNEGDVISFQHTDKNGTRYTTAEQSLNFPRIAAYDSEKQILKTLGALSTSTNKVYMYTVPETVRYIRITLPNSIDNWTELAVVKNIYNVVPYEEYGTNSKTQLKAEYIPEKKNKVIAFLPDEIVCATGRTIEIYNNQICPIAEKYHFRWVCDIGKALKRKFSITGTEELLGDYDLILEIYDDTETCLYSKTSTLKIVTGTIADNVSICPIGDSLTNGKHWLYEVRTLSDNKVSYVGTRGNTEGVKHEGRSGFTSKGYLTAQDYGFENEGVHPFWNGSKFSWSHYKTNSGINPTAVQIFLGTNDLFGNTTAESFSENIKTMVDDIRSTDANMPLFIVMTILTGDQNGLGKQQSTDGFAAYKGKYKYALDCKFIKAMNLLHDTLKDYSNLYFVPLTECHDNEYNFGAVETAVNPRASQKEFMPNEGIHPQQQGYEQMADVMYSVYCQAFA